MNRILLFSGDASTSPSSVTLNNPFTNYEWIEVVIIYNNANFVRPIDCQILSKLLENNGKCVVRPDIVTAPNTTFTFKVTSTTDFVRVEGNLPLVAIYGISFS